MEWFKAIQDKLQAKLTGYPDTILTAALLVGAFLIACIALMENHHLLKVVTLAYIILP